MSEAANGAVEDAGNEGWVDLAHRMVDRFPQVVAGEVVENISRNRQAADAFGLDEAEQLPTVETMTRYQMMQLTGDVPDNARYKPENHVARHQPDDLDDIGPEGQSARRRESVTGDVTEAGE